MPKLQTRKARAWSHPRQALVISTDLEFGTRLHTQRCGFIFLKGTMLRFQGLRIQPLLTRGSPAFQPSVAGSSTYSSLLFRQRSKLYSPECMDTNPDMPRSRTRKI